MVEVKLMVRRCYRSIVVYLIEFQAATRKEVVSAAKRKLQDCYSECDHDYLLFNGPPSERPAKGVCNTDVLREMEE